MYISLNWIRDFVDIPSNISPNDLAQKLTLATVEIEGIKDFKQILSNIVVGKVIKKEKHPDADKLSVCIVFDGEKEYTVVCGASNVYEDMLCAFAKIGAKVRWHGQGDLVTLQKAKIRGVESHGMICAASEINLSDKFREEDGILDLSYLAVSLGTPLFKALDLDDLVLEVDNKSMTHRPDLWGHYGLSRECAAIFKKALMPYEVIEPEFEKDTSYHISIDIENTQSCARYSGVIMKNVTVKESPQWIKSRLIAAGMRPINNIVDITNYVMLELGQPLHAFDVDQISKDKKVNIMVRHAKSKEVLTTLDGNTLQLHESQLVIANEKEVLGLAGIKGGLKSGITEKTMDIFIESANFDPVVIRKGSAISGIRSEASSRFEKSLDPTFVSQALKKAVSMIKEQLPEAVCVNEIIDENHHEPKHIVLETTVEKLQDKIGMNIAKQEMIDILERLEFKVKEENDVLFVHVPSFRSTKDILHSYDLVEEITRIYGYDHITPKMPDIVLSLPKENEIRKLERTIKNILVDLGLTEMYNYSFISKEDTQKIGQEDFEYIEMQNPYSNHITHLRRNLISGLLKNVSLNQATYKESKLFEIGKVCLPEIHSEDVIDAETIHTLPLQPLLLTCVMSFEKENTDNFFQLKSITEQLLDYLKINYAFYTAHDVFSYEQKNATASILSEGQEIGRIGQLSRVVTNAYDINSVVYYATFDLFLLHKMKNQKDYFESLSKYPSVKLDMAVIVDEKLLWQDMKEVIMETGKDAIKEIYVFDVYQGKPIEEGKKNVAFHVKYQSKDKTLTVEEAQKTHEKILKALEGKFEAKLRE